MPLTKYLHAQRGKCFQIGKHDCLTFTNGAWHAMYGYGFADSVMGKYAGLGPKGTLKLMRETWKQTTLIDTLDHELTRGKGFPRRGSLVVIETDRPFLTGYAFGICNGVTSAFLGDLDLVHLPSNTVLGHWT